MFAAVDLVDLSPLPLDDQDPAVVRGDGEPAAVGGRRQVEHPAEPAGGQPARCGARCDPGGGCALEGVVALRVGDPDDVLIAVGLEGTGQSGPYPGFDGQCAGRALPVGDPVDGAARPDGAAAAGTVRGRRVEVAPGVHGVRLEVGALAAEADVETAGSGAFEVVEQPQFAGRGVADAGAVGRRVAGVEAVGLGVPAQVGAVGERGVERADAFVVGEEGETVADPHRAFDVAVEALVDPYELRDAVRSLAFPGACASHNLPAVPPR